MGGLAPRYLIGALPQGVQPHIGTTDVDLVIGVALGDDTPEAYATLQANLKRSGFDQDAPSFRWSRTVDGMTVHVEFLCETDEVDDGAIFRPKDGTGSKMAAFNVRGAMLARDDYIEVELEGERLDRGGRSKVTLRVANLLPYVVLKIFAFQDRHENKDAYDLVFTLLNGDGGPAATGERPSTSPVVGSPQVDDALELLADRFADVDQDGPRAYANFLYPDEDSDEALRVRRQAVATARAFLGGLERFRG